MARSSSNARAKNQESSFRINIGKKTYVHAAHRVAGRKVDVLPDVPDIRDRIYQPILTPLPHVRKWNPPAGLIVRVQGATQSCTGFALAQAIDILRFSSVMPPVSAEMLYEMAKRNDEWEGTAYEGSSLRGAIKGFYRNGVCSDGTGKSHGSVAPWTLTYEMAKEARECRLGAYYRLNADLTDYHCALAETGVIYVSAQIHDGWIKPDGERIVPSGKILGGHAFLIVGYDDTGFQILNSWGDSWAGKGLAHWAYEDWADNVMDAWVLQIGVRAPAAFNLHPRATQHASAASIPAPSRRKIVGHFINIDDGVLQNRGEFYSPSADEMQETVKRLVDPTANNGKGFKHLVLYAHGGLNTIDDEARRIGAWVDGEVFKKNGIYNFHLMWGSGGFEEAFDSDKLSPTGMVGSGFGDAFIEATTGWIGARAWRNMKHDCELAFTDRPDFGGGLKGLQPLFDGLSKDGAPPVLHLVGHSAGSIMLGWFLKALTKLTLTKIRLGSIHLMAPACTSAFFNQAYGPILTGQTQLKLEDKLYLYNLTDELEQADTVAMESFPRLGYGKSLLYLVSRAYEETPNIPLAGMQIYKDRLLKNDKLQIDYASPSSLVTTSRSHGGFDNDGRTLTTIMQRIVAGKVVPVQDSQLTGY